MSEAFESEAVVPHSTAEAEVCWDGLPPAPLTLEGAAVLHQVVRLRRDAWRAAGSVVRRRAAEQAAEWLARAEASGDGQSAVYALLGAKGDLLWVHYRPDFTALHRAQCELAGLPLFDYLEAVWSFLSVVELGLYESTVKLWRDLAARGVRPHSPEWQAEVERLKSRQRQAMLPRLFPRIPDSRWICFYPMNRRRGERKNFYRTPLPARRDMMREHGETGRRFADRVRQVISGSIGLDDWEWGVDLFADDPLAFKQLVYEMRFDEASADYADFGPFYLGMRCRPADLASWVEGFAPAARGEGG
ncbi:MAG: hydrogen peroxide-dependent heme synthase [Bryobacterales bacterium]|nr:heme-dependent peroxidase [Bryobacteraceae bacterium]MDW8131406.1 hydrogen peroxide-dependent heme synthase [Bryobacterales bacterium]